MKYVLVATIISMHTSMGVEFNNVPLNFNVITPVVFESLEKCKEHEVNVNTPLVNMNILCYKNESLESFRAHKQYYPTTQFPFPTVSLYYHWERDMWEDYVKTGD